MNGNPKRQILLKLLKTLVDDNKRNRAPILNEKIQQAVSIFMEETEAEIKQNIIKITMDTSFQSSVKK